MTSINYLWSSYSHVFIYWIISGLIYSGLKFKSYAHLYAKHAVDMHLGNLFLSPFRFMIGFIMLPTYIIAFLLNYFIKSPYVYYAGWGFHGMKTARRIQADAIVGKNKYFKFDPNNKFSIK